jgi:leader peptidase (prepilin peptidase)/N-methyltransferase
MFSLHHLLVLFGVLSMFDFLMSLSDLLRAEPTFFVTFSAIFGLAVGSFLNVVIHRLPKMMEREWHNNCLELQGKEVPEQSKYTIVTPRSACPNCGHNITALENIPVISYLMLSGKCKGCKSKISMRYPLIEALTGAVVGAVACKYGYTYSSLFAFIFVFALVALTFIDFDTQLLPDDITLPLLWLGLLFNLNGGFVDIKSAVLGAVFGYLILWSVYWLFKLVTGKEGMGYGDFKLLSAIGAWFGWQLLPAVILLSSVVGAIIGIAMIMFKGKSGGTAIPFGPFLALGGIAALFFGQQLSAFYLA